MSIKTVLVFLAGTTIGGVAGMYAAKTVIARQSEEELENIRQHYEERIEELETKIVDLEVATATSVLTDTDTPEPTTKEKKHNTKTTKKNETEEAAEVVDYNKMYDTTTKEDPVPAKKKSTPKKKTTKPEEKDIFVIEPDEFRESNGYDKIRLAYFEDEETFIDEDGDTFKDGFAVLGEESLERFGEYEDDMVYVRNKLTETDYAVCYEMRTVEKYLAAEFGM